MYKTYQGIAIRGITWGHAPKSNSEKWRMLFGPKEPSKDVQEVTLNRINLFVPLLKLAIGSHQNSFLTRLHNKFGQYL
ncbi:hypothetical protein M378DRAFT_167417, partial [Amanita muscaria Koide BX008]